MYRLRRPSDEFLDQFLARQAGRGLTYDFPGATREGPVERPGWSLDRERVLLGHGKQVFERARGAIERWEMFPSHMAMVWGGRAPLAGLNVAVVYFATPVRLWILFPARVIYVIEERAGEIVRFGFGYGTLRGHPERGEERFLVEWNRRDDSVWYDLMAVSRPGHWLAWLGYPYTRYEQARIRRLSGEAMRRAIRG